MSRANFAFPIAVFLLLLDRSSQALTLTGQAYEEDNPGKMFCNFAYIENIENGLLKSSKSTHYGADGTELVREEYDYFQGNLTQYRYRQFQTHAEGMATISANKVLMEYKENGKVKRGQEEKTDNVVVGPSLLFYLRERLNLLIRGHKIDIRLVVLDKVKIFDMEAFVTKRESDNLEERIYLSLTPANSIYRLLVTHVHQLTEQQIFGKSWIRSICSKFSLVILNN
jgi:hypothetical protein